MIKPDWWIREKATKEQMITPFAEQTRGGISYGLTSYGYDIRISDTFKVFQAIHGGIIDPKNGDSRIIADIQTDNYIDIPPHGFALAQTVESFIIPRNVLCLVIGKSTYARGGLVLNCTPLEPEWRGTITLELSNTTDLPSRVYANEGVGQVLFFESDEECETSYRDKHGKYQNQVNITLARVLKP